MNITSELQSPIILGHRGASAFAPENTLSAFELAIEQGADGVELDVRLTKDNIPIVIHDKYVDRTTDGSGKISEFKLNEIRSIDAGRWFGNEFAGERIPTLSEVFESLKKRGLINIELKISNAQFDNFIEQLVQLIKRHNNMEQIIISSFFIKNLKRITRVLDDISIALLTHPNMFGLIQGMAIFKCLSPQIIHPFKGHVTQTYLINQHRLNRNVHAWTVNDPSEIKQLIQNGVDGIITDNPKLARTILNSSRNG